MDLSHMLLGDELAKAKSQVKKIFFYRICGTGMGACACLARAAGYEVAGADITFSPPMSTYLEQVEIPLSKLSDVTVEQLQEYDLVIVGNSVPRNSEYASFVEQSKVPFTSFPAFLGEFILKQRDVIGVAGTHGKTTTTHFLSQILKNLGEDPGYFVGGIIDGSSPSHLGTSPFFIIESDEYDSAYFQKISKFRLYELKNMILTSLEFDHADIFDSIEDIKDEFAAVLKEFSGPVIGNDDYQAIDELEQSYRKPNWIRYGASTEFGPKNIKVANGKSSFEISWQGQTYLFQTNVIGEHNILNISSCIALLLDKGFQVTKLQESIKSLGMVKRRQEYRGLYKGSIVIDDFAHHPKAIDMTVDAIRNKYPDKKIITIFEPISATARSSHFQTEFAQALSTSDEVILAMNSLKTTVGSGENLNGDQLKTDIEKNNCPTKKVDSLDDLLTVIDEKAVGSNLLLILSNRTCLGLWESDFVKSLN